MDKKEVELQQREAAVDKRETSLKTLRSDLSQARAQIQAGREREDALADKLTEARKEAGNAKARIAKIEEAFPALKQPVAVAEKAS